MNTGIGVWNPFLHFLLQEGKDVWPIYWVVGVPLIGCNLSQFPMITASYANHHLQSAYLRVRLGMEVRGNLAKLIINVDSHLIDLFFQTLSLLLAIDQPLPKPLDQSLMGLSETAWHPMVCERLEGSIWRSDQQNEKKMRFRMWKVSIWKVLWQF